MIEDEISLEITKKRFNFQFWKSYWDLPPAPLSFPIKGSAGKTGDWRNFRPVVDYEKCTKCYFCYLYCPEGTILVNPETELIEIDLEYCKGCGICASECPKKCIEMREEQK